MIVRELLTRFSFSTDTASQSRLEGTIQRIGGLLGGLAAYASLSSLAGVADAMQSLEARIGMLPQTLGDVGDAFNEVSRRASASRQGIEQYGTLYVRLAGATKEYLTSQEDVLLVTDAISNALVIGGAVASEQASAMLQLSQGFQKGKLDGDEFKSFMETMSTDFKEKLAAQLDTTAAKLYDLSSSGQLTAKKLALAFKAMAPEIEQQMLKMPLTIGQAFMLVGNRFKTMIQNMNRETMIVTKIAKTMIGAFKLVEVSLKNFIKFVGGAENALKLLEIALWAVLVPLGLFGLSKAWGVLKWALAAVTSPLGLIIGLLIFLGLLIDDVSVYLEGGSSQLGDFIDMLTSAEPSIEQFWTSLLIAGLIVATVFRVMRSKIMLAIAKYVMLGAKALIAGARMATAWLIGLGPIGLFILAVLAVIAIFATVVYFVIKYWDDIKAAVSTAIDSIGEAISSIGAVFKDIFYDTPIRWITEMIPRIVEKLKAIGGKVLTILGMGDEPIAANGQPRGRGVPPSVAPGGIANAGKPGTTVTSNQTVNLTVPAGTPEAQQKFLKNAAATSFKDPMAKLSNNLAIVAP